MEETMRTLICLVASAIVLALPFSASRARVDVYRCELADGQLSYQQIPCQDGSKPMKLRDRRSGWSALRPGEKALLKGYREKAKTRHRKASTRQASPAKVNKSCWNKRKQLEAVRSRLHRGYKLDEGDALHRKRDNYEDYLRQFCS